jgi:hypothetical protein
MRELSLLVRGCGSSPAAVMQAMASRGAFQGGGVLGCAAGVVWPGARSW